MTSYYTPLASESLLQIEGVDSLKFLQGQTTCDTGQVDSSHCVAGAYCTPQGRVVGDFLLTEIADDQFVMRMRRDIRELMARTFGKYIVFSKAELSDADQWQLFGCWGEDAATLLEQVFGAVPRERLGSCRDTDFVIIQVDEEGQRFECYLRGDARQLELEELLSPATEESWQAGEIRAGQGRIEEATAETFVPQMLNYDLTGLINFSKGCYTGQEVVARLHYRGTPKRRMYLASANLEQRPEPGLALFGEGSAQSIGNVVNAAANQEGITLLLVVATTATAGQAWRLGAEDGPALALEPQPYALESEE